MRHILRSFDFMNHESKDVAALKSAQREIDNALAKTLREAERLVRLSEDLETRIEQKSQGQERVQ